MDFDEDGDLDIALAMEVHDNVVCYNNGGGDFNSGLGCVPTTGYNSYPYNAQGVVAADIDGDGHQDLIYANGGNTGLPLSQPNVLCWGFGSAGVDCHEFGTDAPSTGLAVGDFDGDGDKDVIVSNRGADNEVCLFNGRGLFSVNFDCRPMPASVYDAYVQINGVWTLVTNTVNPIPPTLSNAVAVGKIGFTYNVAPDALLDVAFANDGTNVVCLGSDGQRRRVDRLQRQLHQRRHLHGHGDEPWRCEPLGELGERNRRDHEGADHDHGQLRRWSVRLQRLGLHCDRIVERRLTDDRLHRRLHERRQLHGDGDLRRR